VSISEPFRVASSIRQPGKTRRLELTRLSECRKTANVINKRPNSPGRSVCDAPMGCRSVRCRAVCVVSLSTNEFRQNAGHLRHRRRGRKRHAVRVAGGRVVVDRFRKRGSRGA
jgi:hypothetical protein